MLPPPQTIRQGLRPKQRLHAAARAALPQPPGQGLELHGCHSRDLRRQAQAPQPGGRGPGCAVRVAAQGEEGPSVHRVSSGNQRVRRTARAQQPGLCVQAPVRGARRVPHPQDRHHRGPSHCSHREAWRQRFDPREGDGLYKGCDQGWHIDRDGRRCDGGSRRAPVGGGGGDALPDPDPLPLCYARSRPQPAGPGVPPQGPQPRHVIRQDPRRHGVPNGSLRHPQPLHASHDQALD
mmetsp:Transcript_2670/g.6443  ORF Transcript_2670/g.6443 Transcript_2670/m.6443 type:complete len:236 (+) Transcript_2670:501-1208(+)